MIKKLVFALLIFSCVLFAQQKSENDEFSYALKLYNEQFYDLAAQQFTRFIGRFPESSRLDEAGFYAGMALFNLRDFQNARIEFQSVAANHPKSPKAAESWFKTGECYEYLQNDAEAAKAYETVNIIYPSHSLAAESILRAGTLYRKTGNLQKAAQLFQLIQDRYLESTAYYPAILADGQLQVQQGKLSTAEDKFKKVLDGSAENREKAAALYEMGLLRLQSGYGSEAKEYFSRIIKNYGKSDAFLRALQKLAEINIRAGDFAAAQKLLQKALSGDLPASSRITFRVLLADCFYLDKKYALAVKNYEDVKIPADKNSELDLILKKALSWQRQGNTARAVVLLDAVVGSKEFENTENYPYARDFLFRLYDSSSRWRDAINKMQGLRSTGELSSKQRMQLIFYYEQLKDWASVIREASAALQSVSDEWVDEFYFSLANAYEQSGEKQEAARLYKKIIREFACGEKYNAASNNLKYLEEFELVDQTIGISQLALLLGDIVNETDRNQLQIRLGRIYFENLKSYEKALEQFKTALANTATEARKTEIKYYIGRCYQKLSEKKSISETERKQFTESAKKYLSEAMANADMAQNGDQIAWYFVRAGIQADNPSVEKQIGYYTMLLQKYPQSNLTEQWLAHLAGLYAGNDSTLTKALKIYDELVNRFSDSDAMPDYLMKRGELRLKLNQGNAADDYKLIVAEHGSSPQAAKALFYVATAFENNGNYDAATQLFNRLLKDYYYSPWKKKVLEQIGNTMLLAGKYDEAIQWFQKQPGSGISDPVLISEFSSEQQINALFLAGKAYFMKGDFDNSRHYLNRYLARSTEGIFRDEAGFLLGEIALNGNDLKTAANYFARVSDADTSLYLKSLQKAADAYFKLGDYATAARQYEQLSAKTDDASILADIKASLIVSLLRSGMRRKADGLINSYRKQFKNRTDHLASFELEKGKWFRLKQEYTSALNAFNKVRKSYKSSSYVDDAAYYSALTYITLNRQKDALDILTSFSKKFPQSDKLGAVYNTLGSIYFRSEKYESAIASFKSAMKQELDRDLKRSVMTNLIKAYTYVNFWDAALALARQYVEAYPEAPDRIDKKIIIAQAYVYLNQFDRAVELLKETRLEADSEKEPEIQFYIGDAYLKAGQYENAIAEFVKIPLLSRKTKLQWEASALYYSGQAYEKLGRIKDAIRMYREIVKRPGIDIVLKKDAQKRIDQIKS